MKLIQLHLMLLLVENCKSETRTTTGRTTEDVPSIGLGLDKI